MQLTITPADDETHRELAMRRYPPPYDFDGAGPQVVTGCSLNPGF
jgi:hypothetical protein